ncbi:organic hydroperoxide resistance protein [Staphylococcus cohnii]|uniref:Osmotically inducible protein C n=1 Tax=Staphylococcus cohnii TaxID=29382 RepID=A0A2T4LV51_9STAP|nr:MULTISPECIES: organic hydroperoxide resistance protein [Staphylococcus]MBA1353033.1 Ohr family peroxiredoxin [Staphylococcus cohnii]MBA1390562.1 Ohr family peroxiredoxin [Staphylococcus cohnii]MBB2506648.1 Organic hydroperoxide resistance protein OhrA [Staphylococcus cohnii subsp. barensis]MBZ8172731.1 organic hydroperoxide resistance protein [Staphylococcus cohnii]MCE5033486.1 organic hydroperoxide resistance protein [Staphylococcus cohnii]
MAKPLFETTVISNGGRDGKVFSEDNTFYQDLAVPKEMGGNGVTESNPEQLFAAGYSACFNNALMHILKGADKGMIEPEVRATAYLLPDKSDGGVKLAAELDVTLKDLSQEEAEMFVEKAHNYCPYSKALKHSIDIEITVNVN